MAYREDFQNLTPRLLCASPTSFNHSIFFCSLLLEFSCVNSHRPIAQDLSCSKLHSVLYARQPKIVSAESQALLRLRLPVSSIWLFLKPPPRVFVCESPDANRSRPFFFETPKHPQGLVATSILWMFHNHPVHCPNHMMRHIWILVEHSCRSLLRPTEGLKCSGDDWTLMLHSYRFLQLELLHEDWVQRFLNHSYTLVIAVHYFDHVVDFEFNIIALKCFKSSHVSGLWNSSIQWTLGEKPWKKPGHYTSSAVAWIDFSNPGTTNLRRTVTQGCLFVSADTPHLEQIKCLKRL